MVSAPPRPAPPRTAWPTFTPQSLILGDTIAINPLTVSAVTGGNGHNACIHTTGEARHYVWESVEDVAAALAAWQEAR